MGKAIVFDIFETLVTENHPEWHTHSPSPARRLGIPEEVFQREWSARYVERMTGVLPNYAETLRAVCVAANVTPPPGEIDALQNERAVAKARPFERVESVVVQMLDELRADQWLVGVISNCTIYEVAGWPTSPLADRVDDVIFSGAEGLLKPTAEIYHLTCERLGCDPARAIFVGDGGSDELRGAHAAGLKAIWATWFIEHWPWDWVGKVSDQAGKFPRCRSVDELPALANALLGD